MRVIDTPSRLLVMVFTFGKCIRGVQQRQWTWQKLLVVLNVNKMWDMSKSRWFGELPRWRTQSSTYHD